MDGQTTEQEEQILTDYFTSHDDLPEEWGQYRELFACFSTDAFDFSDEELNSFIAEPAPKPRTIRLWPWLAAACIAAMLIVFLAPPREGTPLGGSAPMVAIGSKDSLKTEQPEQTTPVMPQATPATTTDKQLAQIAAKQEPAKQAAVPTERAMAKPTTVREPLTVSQAQATSAEPQPQAPTATVNNDLAMAETAQQEAEAAMAMQLAMMEQTEQQFRTASMPIRQRGQQVMHRVAMMQAAHRNQTQFVNL